MGLNPSLPDHWWTLYSLGQWIAGQNWDNGRGVGGGVISIIYDTNLQYNWLAAIYFQQCEYAYDNK